MPHPWECCSAARRLDGPSTEEPPTRCSPGPGHLRRSGSSHQLLHIKAASRSRSLLQECSLSSGLLAYNPPFHQPSPFRKTLPLEEKCSHNIRMQQTHREEKLCTGEEEGAEQSRARRMQAGTKRSAQFCATERGGRTLPRLGERTLLGELPLAQPSAQPATLLNHRGAWRKTYGHHMWKTPSEKASGHAPIFH